MFDEFLNKATALRSAESPFAVAVVVRCQPTVSGKPGDKAIIQPDGSVWGWIGGGCVQPLVIREALKAIEEGSPRLVRIAPTRDSESEDGIVKYSMTCHGGGSLEVYIEPILPELQILIMGRSLAAQTLSRLGKAIGYRVTVVAPGADREIFSDADLIIDELDLRQVKITPQTYIVVSTQGEHDEEALQQALRTDTSYISFIASRPKARKVLDTLTAQGLAPESLSRIKAPAGLDIGASSSREIAVSVLAEIIQTKKSQARAIGEEHLIDEFALLSAKDPVCGMAVNTSAATCASEYRGKTFYFCCGGCKQTFDQRPEAYCQDEK